MATVAQNLETARANYARILAEISDPNTRKPNYTVGDQTYDWTDYQRMILEALKGLDELGTTADGPSEVRIIARA